MKRSVQAIFKAGSLLLMTAFVMTTGCQQKPDPSLALKPIVEKYAEVWNNGNLEALDAIIDPHWVRRVSRLPDVEGVDGAKKVVSGFRTAYPDLKFSIEDEVYSESKCAGRWILTGTNTGPGQMPPTGKSVRIWGITILHFANGKVTGEWVAFDNHSVLEQLGYAVVPPSGTK